ncbi:ribosome biogenesis protein [Methanopyrus kandleri]|uniref:Ribosomal RNA small subunit methyltransferase Nep1 n=2 Tax=Methanopyrus kandleri TaxID=2320 RepID=Q8TYU0_METKA|nr:ribosome biogenesis protein [Methanopyrus kandleri]AAM01419.1 Uncharacterized conserved protein [Methanopyrus kandleri AV19]HII70656.1 16S rRNA methyltransferase [Methanopyrus kandleri]
MPRLCFVLAESELEFIPPKLRGHQHVVRWAKRRGKKPGECLLIASKHHVAMRDKRLPERDRRGRPDIVHVTLLHVLDSPASRENALDVYVHTRHDRVIWFRGDVRLPRDQYRFIGLMEQVLKEGQAPPDSDEPLIEVLDVSVWDVLEANEVNVLLSERGDLIEPVGYMAGLLDAGVERIGVVVGGFPKGDFSEEFYDRADDVVRIYDEPLDAWTVAARIVTAFELAAGILG